MSELVQALSTAGWPTRLITLDDWDALPDDDGYRAEVSEGVVAVVPPAHRRHGVASFRLAAQLDAQVPAALQVAVESDIVVVADPLTVRVPDVLVVSREAYDDAARPRLGASDVVLAVEVASPGTRRTDRVTKASEYAEAAIPHYWLVELDPVVTLTELMLAQGSYVVIGEHVGAVTLDVAGTPVSIDLDQLVR